MTGMAEMEASPQEEIANLQIMKVFAESCICLGSATVAD